MKIPDSLPRLGACLPGCDRNRRRNRTENKSESKREWRACAFEPNAAQASKPIGSFPYAIALPEGGPPESCFCSNTKATASRTLCRGIPRRIIVEIAMPDFLRLANRRTTRPTGLQAH